MDILWSYVTSVVFAVLLVEDMHWLTIPQRAHCKLAVIFRLCLRVGTLKYLSKLSGRQHLRSASGRVLNITQRKLGGNKTAVKYFSCFSQSQLVSAVYHTVN